jgi:hypothetical protein
MIDRINYLGRLLIVIINNKLIKIIIESVIYKECGITIALNILLIIKRKKVKM